MSETRCTLPAGNRQCGHVAGHTYPCAAFTGRPWLNAAGVPTMGRYVYPYPTAIAACIDGWDGGDSYGSATEIAWAIASVAYAVGDHQSTYVLEFRAGPGQPDDLDVLANAYDDDDESHDITLTTCDLATAYRDGVVNDDDLLLGARVILRYLDLCKTWGVDY